MAAPVLVPDLTGLSKAVATANLAAANLTLVSGTGTQTNAIASQSVAAGSIANTGTSVTVTYGTLPPTAQGKGVLPSILATTPTGGYDQWRLVSLTIGDGSPDVPPSDKFTLGTPYALAATFEKGRWTADGYWQASPTDAPVTGTIPDLMKLAASDATIANYIALVAGYLANRAKVGGLL